MVWDKNVIGDLAKRIKETKKELEKCIREVVSEDKVKEKTRLRCKSISSHEPGETPGILFFHPDGKNRPSRAPRFLDFARIWVFIYLASPGHPRLSGARSRTPDKTQMCETLKKLPARRVTPTCQRERSVIVLIVSSSAHRRLPHASSSVRCKCCRRWTSNHAAR
jgi:hypothetical protein